MSTNGFRASRHLQKTMVSTMMESRHKDNAKLFFIRYVQQVQTWALQVACGAMQDVLHFLRLMRVYLRDACLASLSLTSYYHSPDKLAIHPIVRHCTIVGQGRQVGQRVKDAHKPEQSPSSLSKGRRWLGWGTAPILV